MAKKIMDWRFKFCPLCGLPLDEEFGICTGASGDCDVSWGPVMYGEDFEGKSADCLLVMGNPLGGG